MGGAYKRAKPIAEGAKFRSTKPKKLLRIDYRNKGNAFHIKFPNGINVGTALGQIHPGTSYSALSFYKDDTVPFMLYAFFLDSDIVPFLL
jgi:hypothetical protein